MSNKTKNNKKEEKSSPSTPSSKATTATSKNNKSSPSPSSSSSSSLLLSTVKLIALIVLLIAVVLTSLIPLAFYGLYNVNGKGDECELKTNGNSLSHFRTHVNCSDWINPPHLSDYFLVKPDDRADRLETEVQFVAADGFGPISAWFLPSSVARSTDDYAKFPTVIIVHGFRVCKQHFTTLGPAAILHRTGYNVLLIDLRNHGKSAKQMPTPFCTFGSKEHQDIIGAVTYLKQRFGESHAVGIYGVSMGGASTLIASARDERLTAIYLDSPVCQVYETLQGNVRKMLQELPIIRQLVPHQALDQFSVWLMHGTCHFARHVLGIRNDTYGCHPFEYEPSMELKKMKNSSAKAYHFDHATKDILVPVSNTHVCSQIIQSGEHKHVSVHLQDDVGKEELSWSTCKDHTVLVIHEIADKKFEKRLVQFFSTHLPLPSSSSSASAE